MLRRTRRYNVLSKNYFVTRIRLLDNNVIECTLSVESTGQECLEAVAQRLELREVRGKTHASSATTFISLLLAHPSHSLQYIMLIPHKQKDMRTQAHTQYSPQSATLIGKRT